MQFIFFVISSAKAFCFFYFTLVPSSKTSLQYNILNRLTFRDRLIFCNLCTRSLTHNIRSIYFSLCHEIKTNLILWSHLNKLFDFFLNGVPKTNFAEEISLLRSSRPEVFCKKVVLKNFEELAGEHLHQSLFLNKVVGRRRTLITNNQDFLFDLFAYNYDRFIVKNREKRSRKFERAYSINSLANKSFRCLNHVSHIFICT